MQEAEIKKQQLINANRELRRLKEVEQQRAALA
jgi:hypothetical protein